VKKLKEVGFTGPLNIEREAKNHEDRLNDLREAVPYLRRIVDETNQQLRTNN
jgi:sugar phosphate isomerase/epimerase